MAREDERFDDVELRGERVTLRAFDTERDTQRIVAACTDPLTLLWLPLPPHYSPEMASFFCEEFGPQILESPRDGLAAFGGFIDG